MEEKIKNIIAKVREIFKDDNRERLKISLSMDAYVNIKEEKGVLKIISITMGYYDIIEITEKKVTFSMEYNSPVVLLSYNNFDHLLELK